MSQRFPNDETTDAEMATVPGAIFNRHTGHGSVISGNYVSGNARVIYGNVVNDGSIDAAKQFQDDLQTCLRRLNIANPQDEMDVILSHKGELVEESCNWINAELQSFVNSPSRVMWVDGKPGVGKTMIAIHLIRRVRLDNGLLSPTLYFFCRFDNLKRNSIAAVVKSLIFQLLTFNFEDVAVHKRLASHLVNEFRSSPEFTDTALTRILCGIIADLPQGGQVIVDAMDECDSPAPAQLSVLQRLVQQLPRDDDTKFALRWIFTSRGAPLLFKSCGNIYRVDLEDPTHFKLVSKGVEEFIRVKVDGLATDEEIYNNEDPTDEKTQHDLFVGLKSDLTRRAEGSFLWVALMIDRIRGESLDFAQAICNEWPDGLSSLYDRILQQMLDPDKASERKGVTSPAVFALKAEVARRILTVLCVSVRPLSLSELTTAVRLQEVLRNREGHHNSGNLLGLRPFVAHCRSLLSVRDNMVQFVHLSVKDHLMSNRSRAFGVTHDSAHLFLMTSSVLYLQNLPEVSENPSSRPGDLSESHQETPLSNNVEHRGSLDSPKRIKIPTDEGSFWDYASINWARHGQEIGLEAISQHEVDMIRTFLLSLQGQEWFTHYKLSRKISTRAWPLTYSPHDTPDYYVNLAAAAIGIGPFLSALWLNPARAPPNETLERLLIIAATDGHTKVVDLILDRAKAVLEHPAPPNPFFPIENDWGLRLRKTAVKASLFNGRHELLRTIWTPSIPLDLRHLSFAARWGYAETVAFLVKEVGLDVNESLILETEWTYPICVRWKTHSREIHGREIEGWDYLDKIKGTKKSQRRHPEAGTDVQHQWPAVSYLARAEATSIIPQNEDEKITQHVLSPWASGRVLTLLLDDRQHDLDGERRLEEENLILGPRRELLSTLCTSPMLQARSPSQSYGAKNSSTLADSSQKMEVLQQLDLEPGCHSLFEIFHGPNNAQYLPSRTASDAMELRIQSPLVTPFEAAIRGNSSESLGVLLSASLDLGVPYAKEALSQTVRSDRYSLVELLLKAGVDPDTSTSAWDGGPAISVVFLAALNGNHWMVKLILEFATRAQTQASWNAALQLAYTNPKLHWRPTTRARVMNKSYNYTMLAKQRREVAVTSAFRLIAGTLGELPDGWTAHSTWEGDDYFVVRNVAVPYVTWQDPRVPCEEGLSMDEFWGEKRPPTHQLEDFDTYLDLNFDISAPSPTGSEDFSPI